MTNLLQTKIELPPLRQPHIYRERIVRQVDAHPAARLVLVSAPAGFGKSTSLLQWAQHQREGGTLVAWYAVDERDNDLARFAAYLLAALRAAGVELLSAEIDDRPEIQEAVTIILNGAAKLDRPVLLLLDDYHLIVEPKIHDAIRRLCEYMPANMRLAIGTRIDPPLPLARMRARGTMAEIRMADLRFDVEELRAWCAASLGWTPSPGSIEGLARTTEGWAAALALILMSQPHADEQALENQLARYSQSQRHIFDYFAQEILEQQPAEIGQFLLDTSVLNRLTPALCTALTDSQHAPLLLERLAGESLFVIPLSNVEPVYRYHHLFAQFLRQYLALRDRERYLRQHRRAASWYAGQDGGHEELVEAVEHALSGEDFDYAARLIQDDAYALLMARGEFMTLINWLPRFTTAVLARHPRLWLYFVRALYLGGQVELAEKHVRLSGEALDWDGEDLTSQQALRAIAYNYRATLAAYRGDLEKGLRWIERAQALEEGVDPPDRLRIANAEAFIRYLIGDVPAARRAYRKTLAQAEQLDDPWVMLDTHYYLAQLDLLACDLQAAQERCERLLAAYPAGMAPRIPLMLPLADSLYQRDQTLEAERLLREALAQTQSASQPSTSFFAHLALSALLAARGEIAEAEASIRQARAWAAGYQSPMIDGLIDAAEAQMMLQAGRLEEAVAWATRQENAEGAGPVEGHRYQEDAHKIILARIWLAQGEHEQALAHLARTVESAQTGGRTLYVLQAESVRALAYQAAGAPEAALSALERALALAEPQHIVRPFLDLGRPMRLLLRQVLARHPGSPYVQFLLDSAERAEVALHPADLLTEREIEVLEQVATGASNQEIAEALVISVGTVKSHIHHIMNKLDVKNRTEAVGKARTLNILPD